MPAGARTLDPTDSADRRRLAVASLLRRGSAMRVLPLLVVLVVTATLATVQARRLSEEQIRVLEWRLIEARQDELRRQVEVAIASIAHLYESGRDDEAAKSQARAILGALSYGEDGYFYVYDFAGRSLVHPRKPEFVGTDKWALTDPDGVPVIQQLIARAREGGGFVRYEWDKPSSGESTAKLGYAAQLPRWGWMIGTGLYLDDVGWTVRAVRQEVESNVNDAVRWLGGLAALSCLVVFGAGTVLRIGDRRVADRTFRQLARRIVTLQEEERARVSRELHDGLSQQLVSLKYRFELSEVRLSARGSPEAPGLREAIAGLGGTIAEVRRISHALRPAVLDARGLEAALAESAQAFERRTGVRVTLRCLDDRPSGAAAAGAGAAGDEASTTVLRLAQEALANVDRHARARTVSIELRRRPRSLSLQIVDDGVGFDLPACGRAGATGIGLRNMRERVRLQGGAMRVSSRPGRTALRATVPIRGGRVRAG